MRLRERFRRLPPLSGRFPAPGPCLLGFQVFVCVCVSFPGHLLWKPPLRPQPKTQPRRRCTGSLPRREEHRALPADPGTHLHHLGDPGRPTISVGAPPCLCSSPHPCCVNISRGQSPGCERPSCLPQPPPRWASGPSAGPRPERFLHKLVNTGLVQVQHLVLWTA